MFQNEPTELHEPKTGEDEWSPDQGSGGRACNWFLALSLGCGLLLSLGLGLAAWAVVGLDQRSRSLAR